MQCFLNNAVCLSLSAAQSSVSVEMQFPGEVPPWFAIGFGESMSSAEVTVLHSGTHSDMISTDFALPETVPTTSTLQEMAGGFLLEKELGGAVGATVPVILALGEDTPVEEGGQLTFSIHTEAEKAVLQAGLGAGDATGAADPYGALGADITEDATGAGSASNTVQMYYQLLFALLSLSIEVLSRRR